MKLRVISWIVLRDVEEMMSIRGVSLTYETVREWCLKFGQTYANDLRHRSPRPGDWWCLDEVFRRINRRSLSVASSGLGWRRFRHPDPKGLPTLRNVSYVRLGKSRVRRPHSAPKKFALPQTPSSWTCWPWPSFPQAVWPLPGANSSQTDCPKPTLVING